MFGFRVDCDVKRSLCDWGSVSAELETSDLLVNQFLGKKCADCLCQQCNSLIMARTEYEGITTLLIES